MNATQPIVKTISEGVLEYETTLHPVELKTGEIWNDRYSIPMTMQFAQNNIPSKTSVYFSEGKSRVECENADLGWKGWTAQISDPDHQAGWLCKKLQFLKICVPYDWQEPITTSEEQELPEIALSEEHRPILGYNCRKANYQLGNRRWEIWFSEDLDIVGNPRGIIRKEGIQGTIFSIKEFPRKGQFYTEETNVKKIRITAQRSETFVPPLDCRRFNTIEEAMVENRRLLAGTFAARSEKVASFDGIWKIKSHSDEIYLEVVITGKAVALKTRFFPSGLEENTVGTVSGDWILIDKGQTYQILQMHGRNKISDITFSPFTWVRSTRGQMDAAMQVKIMGN